MTLLAVVVPSAKLQGHSPQQAVVEALADAKKLPPGSLATSRYLAIGTLPDKQKEDFLRTLTFHVNQLSRNPVLIPPTLVSPNLIRVNLLDYGWSTETWEKLANIDPYFHLQTEVEEVERWGVRNNKGEWEQTETRKTGKKTRESLPAPWLNLKSAEELYSLTGSQVPLVRADWFFTQTARQLSLTNKETGAGYYNFLGLKDRNTFEKLIRLNVKDSVDFGRDMRAAVENSGVATQGRQIVRYQGLGGGAWVTLDVDDASGDGNPLRNLKAGTFKHKAEEHYGTLPNGLFAFLLCDAEGKLQNSAPDFIGSDDSALRVGRDTRIHVCLACNRCHVEGLRDIADWTRRRAKSITSPDYKELLDLRRQYFSNLTRQLGRDRLVYQEALREVNGWTPAENAKNFAAFWDYSVSNVDAERAAREMGVTVEMLRKTFATSPDPSLAGLAAIPSEPVTQIHWQELFAAAMGAVKK